MYLDVASILFEQYVVGFQNDGSPDSEINFVVSWDTEILLGADKVCLYILRRLVL